MKRRSFRSLLGSDPMFAALPSAADPGELESLTARLLEGDEFARSRLIELHIKIVTAVAGRMAPSNAVDDAIQEANLELIDAVDRASKKEALDNITTYLVSCARYAVRAFLNRNRCVYMPGRTFRHKAKEGKIDKDGDNLDPALVGVMSTMKLVMSEEREARTGSNEEHVLHIGRYMPGYTIPEARSEEPDFDLVEILKLSIHTPEEQAFVEMASEGFTNCEIAIKYGVSARWVGVIVKRVQDRFDNYMTA